MGMIGRWMCRRGWHKSKLEKWFIYEESIRWHWQGGYERWLGMECRRCGHRHLTCGYGYPIPVPTRRYEDDTVYHEALAWESHNDTA